MSKVEEKVIKQIRNRAEVGLKKYGKTLEREDFSFLDWLQHLQEELMDAACYVEKLKEVYGQESTKNSKDGTGT